jgi:hypothetical protein
MAKDSGKPPTIQDLSREELLRLIPMISPLWVDPALILRAQIEVASDQHRDAAVPMLELSEAAERAFKRWRECTKRDASQKVTDKAWRAWLAARDASETACRRTERLWRRWERLTDQYRTLMDGVD